MSKNLLVADIGTQSLRVSIITPQGDTLAFDQEKYEVPYFSPQNDFAEQDVDFYIDTLCQATRKLREEDPSAFETIGGMVIDDFRDSSVILDKEKKRSVRRFYGWTTVLPHFTERTSGFGRRCSSASSA